MYRKVQVRWYLRNYKRYKFAFSSYLFKANKLVKLLVFFKSDLHGQGYVIFIFGYIEEVEGVNFK